MESRASEAVETLAIRRDDVYVIQEIHLEQPAAKTSNLDFFGVAMIKTSIVLVY